VIVGVLNFGIFIPQGRIIPTASVTIHQIVSVTKAGCQTQLMVWERVIGRCRVSGASHWFPDLYRAQCLGNGF